MPDFEIEQEPADDIPWKTEALDTLPHLRPDNGAQPKASPYVRVTWMSKIIAGEAFCEWSLWSRNLQRRFHSKSLLFTGPGRLQKQPIVEATAA